MNLVKKAHLTALSGVAIAFALWAVCISVSQWLIGGIVAVALIAMVLANLARHRDVEVDDPRPDLTRQALVWKTLATGNSLVDRFSLWIWLWMIGGLSFALAYLYQGTFTLQQALEWWLVKPVQEGILLALFGFCAGSAWYLLMRWTDDLDTLRGCTETQLLNETNRQKRRIRFAHS